MTTTRLEGLRNGKYHPSKLNNGASIPVNNNLKKLIYSPTMTDDILTADLESAIDAYLENKILFIFAEGFEGDSEDGYQSVISALLQLHIDSAAGLSDPKLADLFLRTFFSKNNFVNYAMPASADSANIIVRQIKPWENSKLYDLVIQKITKSIKDNEYDPLFQDTFLATIIEKGYTYNDFKAEVAKKMSEGLISGDVLTTVSISRGFLGLKSEGSTFDAGDGPLKFVSEGANTRLNKEFPSLGITNSTTIPSAKISKFKEASEWLTLTSIFGKTGETDEVITFTDDQIDKFAGGLVGKDLSEYKFNYYTGEVYDEWGDLWDSGYWLDALEKYGEAAEWSWNLLKEETGAFVAGAASLAGIQTAIWGHALLTFEIAPFTLGAAVPTAAPVAGWWTARTAALRSAGKWIITKIANPYIWLALVNIAIIAGIGYALWNAGTPNHKERLEKTILDQYVGFLGQAIVTLSEGSDAIGDLFRSQAGDVNFLRNTLSIFAIDKEVERRLRIWSRLSLELKRDEDFFDNDEGIKNAIDDSIGRGFKDIPLPEIGGLSKEQITDRQKFYKQCALMMNIGTLAPIYEGHIIARQKDPERADGPNTAKPYGGRFWRATSENKEKLLNNLFSSEKSQYLFEIPTHVMTQLTPKFRLYKVLNDAKGKLQRTEFVFPMNTDITRKKNFTAVQASRDGTVVEEKIQPFLESQFDKGDGVGLKSFTLDFNGTNPAEARNDVKGSMTLFFQSFADFVRERVDHNGNKFSFVDLIVQPKPDDPKAKKKHIQGIATSSLRQYDASFYRIMVETGYNVPDTIEGIGSNLSDLQSAIKNMNKSFYLCMIDHDFNINNDGTVVVNLTYRAYVETALKSLRFDALTTPELAQQRIENENKLFELATSKECTKDQLKDVQILIASIEEEIIKNSLNSILRRLQERKKVFTIEINDQDRRQFLDNGYFRKCDIVSRPGLAGSEARASEGDLGVVLNTRLPERSSDFDFNDSDRNDTLVQFFFFGDLLHTILDALYIENNDERARGLKNTMIVLGSFDFEAFQKESGSGPTSFNIADIPISIEFFSRWFVDNVLNQKSTRKSFPILNFIRSLSNAVVNNALLESCVNRDIEQRLIFQTGQFSSYSDTGEDIIGQNIENTFEKAIMDTDSLRGTVLPLEGSPAGDSKIENFFHYIILNPNGSTRSHQGIGDYSEDIGSGVFHIEIGSNRGLTKTVNFSKTDLQFLREARFFRNGIDGLLQLSSVYSVSIEMFGNTLFYPGMDLWLNPYGVGGTALGHPRIGASKGKRSLANALGLGGYHTITSVSTTLTPNSFTTNIKAQHYYSGDGELGSVQPKVSVPKGHDDQLIEMGIPEDEQSIRAAANCKTERIELQNFLGNNSETFDADAYIESRIEAETSSNDYPPSAAEAVPESTSSAVDLTSEEAQEALGDGAARTGVVVVNRTVTNFPVDGVFFDGVIVSYSDGVNQFEYSDAGVLKVKKV